MEGLAGFLGSRSFLVLVVASALIGLSNWTVVGWMPVFLQEHFNLSQSTAGFSAAGYMNAAAFPGLLIGGFLADRWGRTNQRSRVYLPAIGFVLAIPGILRAAGAHSLPLAALGLVVYSLFQKFSDANIMPILCEIGDRRYLATGYGLINFANTISGGLGILISGMLRDSRIDLSWALISVAAILLLCAALFLLIRFKGDHDCERSPKVGQQTPI
jgi:MFS family permease